MSTATATHDGSAGEAAGAGRMRAQSGRVEHLTRAERAARGKSVRAEVPRCSHAGWEPASARRDPVDVLEDQAQTRVLELVPIRYGRMLVSPFTFYRGAAALMAADLAVPSPPRWHGARHDQARHARSPAHAGSS